MGVVIGISAAVPDAVVNPAGIGRSIGAEGIGCTGACAGRIGSKVTDFRGDPNVIRAKGWVVISGQVHKRGHGMGRRMGRRKRQLAEPTMTTVNATTYQPMTYPGEIICPLNHKMQVAMMRIVPARIDTDTVVRATIR